uniref:Uncharacterized protein n=1 Tax=Anguilla anguilla TaxID=7936 RepID=A0A0E9T4D6_ANGAN
MRESYDLQGKEPAIPNATLNSNHF